MDTLKIKETLEDAIADAAIALQVNKSGDTQLILIMNRLDGATVEYEKLADRLMTVLLDLDLGNIQSVKFYGRSQGNPKPEWQSLRAFAPEPVAMQRDSTATRDWWLRLDALQGRISAIALVGILAIMLHHAVFGQKQQDILWEYRIDSINDLTFTINMNVLGAQGWELVAARRAKDSSDTFAYECIFKRRAR